MSVAESSGGGGSTQGGASRGAPGVLLVAHGSHRSADSGRPVRELALALRRSGRFADVGVGFWKEDPHLTHALATMEAGDVCVVPVFTSVGYFTQRVVPRELGIGSVGAARGGSGSGAEPPGGVGSGAGSLRGAGSGAESPVGSGPPARMRVRYLAPVGTHPRMADLVLDRASEAMDRAGWGRPHVGPIDLVVVGHGTPRHPESGRVTSELAERVAERWRLGEVRPAFLDQDPAVGRVIGGMDAARVVVVPFFISDGWHAGATLPLDLGVEEGVARLGGKEIRYSAAVGTHPAMGEVVAEMVAATVGGGVREEAADGVASAAANDHGQSTLAVPASAAREDFVGWLQEGGAQGRLFLQVCIRRSIRQPRGGRRERGFEIRHAADAGRPDRELETHRDPGDAVGIAALDEAGVHRPLKTAPDLARGWRLSGLTADEVWEALRYLYPSAAVHWHMERAGTLPVVSFQNVAARQSGLYAGLTELSPTILRRAMHDTCERRCLRKVRWGRCEPAGYTFRDSDAPRSPGRGAGPPPVPPPRPPQGGAPSALDEGAVDALVPCPEPCSILLERTRELVVDEEARGDANTRGDANR